MTASFSMRVQQDMDIQCTTEPQRGLMETRAGDPQGHHTVASCDQGLRVQSSGGFKGVG